MAPASTVIDFYFDVVSPYSWIAFEAFDRYADKLPARMNFKPFYLAAVMKSSGNKPPALVPARGVQMMKDLDYNAQYWGIPLKPPTDFVGMVLSRNNTLPLRFLTALNEKYPNKMVPVARAIWTRLWSRDLPIDGQDDVREAAERAGLDFKIIDELLVDAHSEKIREILKDTTQEAADSGAYGAPWIVVKKLNQGELTFFGSDRMPLICHQLGVDFEGPLKSKL